MNKLEFPLGYGLGYAQVVHKDKPGFKSPMLIVGANTYIMQRVDPELYKTYDLFLFFFPHSGHFWRVGLLGMNKNNITDSAFLITSEGVNIVSVLANLMAMPYESIEIRQKGIIWLTHSIYRCPKISLKDILSLEPYKSEAA
jgi:hypothetical protein